MKSFASIERWLFYILIFFIPFETRVLLGFWGGGFNEWNSAAFYLTDLILLSIIALWIVRIIKDKPAMKIGKIEITLIIFLGVSAFSILKAENLGLSAWRMIKLFELGALFFYVKNNLNRILNLEKIMQIFVLAGSLQALIAVGQFVRQKSFGLSFLDESPLGADISGVAKIVVGGVKLIRPYGLTPHPNILAAFLLIAIFCGLILFTRKNRDYHWGSAVFYSLIIAFLTFAFFITFSRAVIAIGLIGIFGWLIYLVLKSERKWFILNTIVIFSACCLMVIAFLWPYLSARFDIESGLSDQSFNLRVFYDKVALNFIKQNPLLGVGLGNFVWTFQKSQTLAETWMYQPAHNIFLLITSEIGIFGLLAFLCLLFLIVKRACKADLSLLNGDGLANWGLLFMLLGFLGIGFLDHFFWTLQQGQLMFWILLGIIAGLSPYSSKDPEPNLPS